MKNLKNSAEDMRKIYFGAGPAALPESVLQEAAEAVRDYNKTGLSILEIPHRGKLFQNIVDECKALVRELCSLSAEYEVIWLQGGGRLQFTMLPLNFLQSKAAYIDSGHWSDEAIKYARHYGDTEVIASSKSKNYTALPQLPQRISGGADYLHYTTNNTIYGTQWQQAPKTDLPLVADMSSDILSRNYDFAAHNLIYAVAQKNLGAAGATLVIIHKDFLKKEKKGMAPMLQYSAHVAEDSALNTPPVFAIYTCLLMLRWTRAQTLATIEAQNVQKAAILYREIDRNPLFYGTVKEPADRSLMNATFRCHDENLEKAFITMTMQQGIEGIVGHRSVGGFRASMYNAVPMSSVEKLVAVMQEFERVHQVARTKYQDKVG